MQTLLILQHVAHEGPGMISQWATKRGFDIRLCHLDSGEPLPSLGIPGGDIAGILILGGPMNIYEDESYPWLREERHWIAGALDAGHKMFGICLGSQFLADTLGGKVTRNREREVGWAPVYFSNEARAHWPFLPQSRDVLHWHGDTFALPAQSIPLGKSQWCDHQGFVWAKRVVGLQFHLEAGLEETESMIQSNAADLVPGPGVQSAGEIRKRTLEHAGGAKDLLFQMLDEWQSA